MQTVSCIKNYAKKFMRKVKLSIAFFAIVLLFEGCGVYSFSGVSISPDTNTFQVNFFQNQAPRIFPGTDQIFTNQLQDLILNQTNLNLTTSNGDLIL